MHRKGLHCGSTAMGDALRRLGLDLPEETIFGLGAGLGFSLHNGDVALSPPQASRFLVGRSASFESDLCRSTGATLHPEHFADANAAWERIDELLRRDELPLVYVDLFELPYMGAHGHWFGHLIAVASPQALVWDNEFAEPQRIEPAQLRRALCNPEPVRGEGCTVLHVTGRPHPGDSGQAILRNALQMTEEGGLEAIDQFAEELPELQKREDWHRIARLCIQAIEVRGCGGALFRNLYARFLREALPELAPRCENSAAAWTQLARELTSDRALACAEAEGALWSRARELCE